MAHRPHLTLLKADALKRESQAESRRKRRKYRPSISQLRVSQLVRLFAARYRGSPLPNDDAGRDDLAIMAHHLVALPGNPETRLRNWSATWAPWLTIVELNDLTRKALRYPRRWKADRLAWRLRVTDDERRALKLTTIGAIDRNKGTRAADRRKYQREAKERERRSKGIKPRHEYEAKALTNSQPWKALNISRRTYYRQLKSGTKSATLT